MEYLPEGFDFEGSVIRGKRDSYHFNRYLKRGSQGKVLLYSGKHDVIFKIYEPGNDSSTQNSSENFDRKYWPHINEKDMLLPVALMARISTYYNELRANHDIGLDSNLNLLIDGEKLHRTDFIEQASTYDNLEKIRADPFCITPLPIDYATTLEKSNKRYIPSFEPDFQLHADNVCPYGHNGELYTYEKGHTLDSLLREGKKDKDIAHSVINAVSMLHWMGVMHRDLKPENIIVNPDGRIKILDFGIAMRFTPSDRLASLTGMENHKFMPGEYRDSIPRDWFGSRYFSAPEHLLPMYEPSGEYSNKHDMFSLGILAALIETGKHPFINRRYSDFIDDKDMKRNYAKRLKKISTNRKIKRSFKANHKKFEHLPYASLFDPNPLRRPNRLSILAKDLGIQYPEFPPYFGFLGPSIEDFCVRHSTFADKLRKMELRDNCRHIYWNTVYRPEENFAGLIT
ncbi:MAG: protein kinase domain-containing protein [Candidatus Woesearchaeota archaeon]